MIDPQLLEYYNQELVYMRESAAEFGDMHPKIAKRLGMNGTEVADPYVERLIEGFCFMSARMRIKLDAEFPRFTQRLLEVIYPNYVSPTPSMAVVQLHPDLGEGDLTKGYTVPRGSSMYAKVPEDEVTACEFTTTQDIKLWPLDIVDARLSGVPPDIPSFQRYLPPHIQPAGSLRLRLRLRGEVKFSELDNLDSLPIYLSGDEQIASHLFEILHTSAVASFVGQPGKLAHFAHPIIESALVPEGLNPENSMLPLGWNSFQGHNLLHEYFTCPSRFYFFKLQHLAAGFAKIHSNEAEIVILLTRDTGYLRGIVDAKQFSLFCTPIINLFKRRTDRLEIDSSQTEFHLVPDRSRPMDFEVYSIQNMYAQEGQVTEKLEFRALYQTLHQDEGNYGRYFSVRREPRLASDSSRKYGTRSPYTGTEIFISLVDQNEAPYQQELRYVSMECWLTNRDLPQLVPRNGLDDLSMVGSIPISAAGLIRAPSRPKPPFAQGELAWRLIRQLSFNYLPLADMPHREGAQALRDMLRMFVHSDDTIGQQQVQSLIGSRVQPITRRLPGSGPLVYGRGVQCHLTLDEDGFSGISPYLFGVVLEQYLARHVAINVFTEVEMESMQRGLISRWPVRMGTRGVV